MTVKKLIVIRGPSGSGKTTIAQDIVGDFYNDARGFVYYEADHFFEGSQSYKFDAKRLSEAHAWCKAQVTRSMFHEVNIIVLSNTATMKWEVDPYLELAKEYGYDVRIARTPGPWDANVLAERNLHSVPLTTIRKQIDRYEPYEDEFEWIIAK